MPSKSSFTFAVQRFRIKRISCAAALSANTSVAADCVIAALCLQALVIIDLALVDVLASVREWIECKSDFAVAPITARHIRADLVGVARLLIGTALVNIWRQQEKFLFEFQWVFHLNDFLMAFMQKEVCKLTHTLILVNLITVSAFQSEIYSSEMRGSVKFSKLNGHAI